MREVTIWAELKANKGGRLDLEKTKRVLFSILFGVLILGGVSFYIINGSPQQNLIYVVESSYHGYFYILGDYVIEKDIVTVENTTDQDLKFNMLGDFSKYSGLFSQKEIPAYVDNTFNNNQFDINGKSEQAYTVYFRSRKGQISARLDRLPIKKIQFKVDNAANEKQ